MIIPTPLGPFRNRPLAPKEEEDHHEPSMPNTPPTPDIAVGRHALLARAFETFGTAMEEFVEERMVAHLGDDDTPWNLAAADKLGRGETTGTADPLFQLLVIRRFWGPVFSEFFGGDLRPMVGQLIEARNLWAHFNLPSETKYSDHLLLAMERIVAPVAPEVTSQLRSLRAELYDPARGDSEITIVDASRPDTVSLIAELRRTEAAFEDLQRRYGQLTDQLTATRRAAAGKQLKLSAAENRATVLEREAHRLRSQLTAELESRNRMEWLFVGFIAVMVLVMTLLSL